MLLFVYTTTRKRFEIFTCRYFKLSWNTTALLANQIAENSHVVVQQGLSMPIFIIVITKCSSLQDFPPRKFGESHDFFPVLNTFPSSGSLAIKHVIR